jgi:hypothetical protein
VTDTETVAAAIHETYRELSRQEGWSMRPDLDRPYAELAEPDKEDNRAAARRMGDVLAVARLALSDDPAALTVSDDALRAALEPMAEIEHNGWMAQRAQNGWTWGEVRDDGARRHPSMRPYRELPESEKDKDRNNVRHYPDFAARAGYRIVRSGAPC